MSAIQILVFDSMYVSCEGVFVLVMLIVCAQARMLQEGKQLQRKDDTRFATYKIGIDTDSCAFLMRWIRSQPKALQPTQMRVSDGDGIRELTPEEQNKMHNGGLGEENEEDNDEPTFLLQSADERAFRLVFNWNGEAVPMWITVSETPVLFEVSWSRDAVP